MTDKEESSIEEQTQLAEMIAIAEQNDLFRQKPTLNEASGRWVYTGEQYRGINVLLLWLAAEERGYCSAHWFTYRQAAELGAQVRKGEKASTVVKYGTIERENDQGEDKKIPYTKAYRVFNADQIDGLPEAFYRQPEPPKDLGIRAHLEEVYGLRISADLVSRVTDAVLEVVSDWQNRALEPVYPIVFLDALRVKIRDAKSRQVKNKAVYVALGVTPEGEREVLGLWVAAN